MIEIIARRDGQKADRAQISGQKVQASFNSDGHLIIRVYSGQGQQDTLVVLDYQASETVINFIQSQLRYKRQDDIPF